ncbi:MAG: DUF3450 domain-containing protein [Proteobacteria bacterium]|jgi:predicted RNase H-like nuclease (RuvC/YqgF family)|nr:DUF3450 domain-containing protein [Pseudomonadota bacterium]MDA1301477.1 DUF3450 domain-containing protein [Pseudomonadota bacterium]
MKEHRISPGIAAVTVCLLCVLSGGSALAQSLDEILGVRTDTTELGRNSQRKIDSLSEETRDLLTQYKQVMKIVEGLRIYNQQQERLIRSQEKELGELEQSIDQVTVIERQMGPLIERMIANLEKFVELDMPFLMKEREDRIEFLKDTFDRADVSVAEKFSQVLQAYQVENTYGKTLDVYTEVIDLGGQEKQVEILKWGRVALVFKTLDGEVFGVWDRDSKDWQTLGNEYRAGIRDGFRIAKKTQTADFVPLPIAAPK